MNDKYELSIVIFSGVMAVALSTILWATLTMVSLAIEYWT